MQIVASLVLAAAAAMAVPLPPTGAKVITLNGSDPVAPEVAAGAGQPTEEVPLDVVNPIVKVPDVVHVGQPIDIQWTQPEHAAYGYVNIDVRDACGGLLGGPLHLAAVPTEEEHFQWTPPSFLKPGDCYQVQVWGMTPPRAGDATGHAPIKIVNDAKDASYQFRVDVANEIRVGQPVEIKWDFNPATSYPSRVNINLVNSDGQIVYVIAENVDVQKRDMTWTPSAAVLDAANAIKGSEFFVQVDGGSIPSTEKRMASSAFGTFSNYGANSAPVTVSDVNQESAPDLQLVPAADKEDKDDNTDDNAKVAAASMSSGAGNVVASTMALIVAAALVAVF